MKVTPRPPAKPSPAPPSASVESLPGTDITIARNVAIPMRDGQVLRANVFAPRKPGRYPVIINVGPYGKDVSLADLYPAIWAGIVRHAPEVLAGSDARDIVWEVPDPHRWVPDGYVLIHADSRGSGRSAGVFGIWGRRSREDYADAVEWAGTQHWSNGKVGVLGVSYYALAAWAVAAEQPEHLAAIIPWNGAADVYRDSARHGGILSNFPEYWWNRWLANQHGNPQGLADSRTGERSTGPEAWDEDELAARREDIDRELVAHDLDDAWFRERSIDWSRVTVPFLSVGSWGTLGLHLRGNTEAFTRAASEDKWMTLLAGRGGGIEEFYSQPGLELQRAFFDAHLKDRPEAWQGHPRARVVCRAQASGQLEVSGDSWPLPSTEWTKMHLDLGGLQLGPEPMRRSGERRYHALSQGTTFTSAPFAHETVLAGPAALNLWVSTTARDMDIFSSLRVVDRDGLPIGYHSEAPGLVARGWLRLSHRKQNPDLTTPWRPFHAHDELLEVAPGEVYEVAVELWPIGVVIPEGARLALTVQGEDDLDVGFTRHQHSTDRPWEQFRGLNTLHASPSRPAYLLLPVIPAAAAS